MQSPDPGELDEVDAALADARREFVAAFEPRCDRMAALIETVATTRSATAATELAQVLHRLGGLGGTVGLPTVTARARAFEDLVRDAPDTGFDVEEARHMLAALRAAFRDDLSR